MEKAFTARDAVMISSLQFQTGYPTRLEKIGRHIIRFNGWTNLVVGPNGSGKSTIIRTLAANCGCGDGGWSDQNLPANLLYNTTIDKDEQPVFYQDCYEDSERSFIDIDFLESNGFLRSSGEKRIGLVNELIAHIEARFLSYKLPRETRPTLLLDEIDNHVSFTGQAILWNHIIPKLSKKYQLILSTHSIFPILLYRTNSIKPDNLIDLGEKFSESCITELEKAVRVFNKFQD